MSNVHHSPVSCDLETAQLREREATLLVQFRSAVLETEELEDGYAFRLSGEANSVRLVAELIVAERECCPFLAFELTAVSTNGPVSVRVTGPDGTKEFFRTILCKTGDPA